MSLLAVRDLRVTYGKVVALDRVTLAVEEGEVVTLVGSNGAGKSSLLKALMGLVPVAGGEIELAGARTIGRRAHEMARLGVGYVPEGRGTLRSLTVRENLLLGAFARPRGEDVAAFVVASRPVEPAALLEHCRAELASFKVPRHLWLRREDELPVRGSGKVDKALLRAEAARLVGA